MGEYIGEYQGDTRSSDHRKDGHSEKKFGSSKCVYKLSSCLCVLRV